MKRVMMSLLTGLWGGATMWALSAEPGLDSALILPAAVAATCGGALTAPLFGRPRRLWAFAAPLLATTLGAALAGAYVGFPQDIALGLAFGPLLVWACIAQNPVVAGVWLIGAFTLRRAAYSLK